MVGVRNENACSALDSSLGTRCQAALILPTEERLVIVDEPVIVMPGYIRRIEKDEIAIVSSVDDAFEIVGPQLDATAEGLAAGEQIFLVDDIPSSWQAIWDVVLASGVHAVQAIPTCAIQEQELCSSCESPGAPPLANVVKLLSVQRIETLEIPPYQIRTVPDRAVRLNEFRAGVVNNGSARRKQKEERSAAEEWLEISDEVLGQAGNKLW